MDKYENSELVEQWDAIILLNDNYADEGLLKGYVGSVFDDTLGEDKTVMVEFINPITFEYINPVAAIKTEDFRVLSQSSADRELVRAYRDLFKK